ncbi:MAG: hypothetical protein MZV70_22540 [Desulfobacterales bacterium]|nr:hypothetical protein [Desulfobacterales bacterium]
MRAQADPRAGLACSTDPVGRAVHAGNQGHGRPVPLGSLQVSLGYTATVHGQKAYNGVAVLSRDRVGGCSGRGLPSGFLA